MRHLIILFFLTIVSTSVFPQVAGDSSATSKQDCNLRISLLTCSPGDDLYTTFGHTAIRVVDSALHTDKVYNYGTFDFSDPQAFYIKFIKGGNELRYFLSIDDFNDFMQEYIYYERSVEEQVLNMNCSEKTRLNKALQINANGENKFYRYDFLFDNCSTRPYEIISWNLDSAIKTANVLPSPTTSFRDLIHFYLNQNKMYWSELGIDILLGKGIDRPMKNEEAMFLPEFLYKGFDVSTTGKKNLVLEKKTLFNAPAREEEEKNHFTPLIFFGSLLMLFLVLAFINRNWSARLLGFLDFILLFLVGIMGIVILLMWFATDHSECRNNLNILWAIPLQLPAAFMLRSKKTWMHQYWLYSSLVYILVLLLWLVLPQKFNTAVLPLVFLLAWRSWTAFKKG